MAKKAASSPIFRLPPYTVTELLVSCSETMDWGLSVFGIPHIWSRTKGKDAKVAVLDTGAALKHPDLRTQIADAKDFSGSKHGPMDVQGHGTHCCGIIAGAENGVGIVGVAPEARLYIGKVLGDDGTGNNKAIVRGIRWAMAAGVDVISMSFGSPKPDKEIHAAVKEAAAKGILICAASGNEGPDPNTVGYPAGFIECLSVAAVDKNRKVANFSSRGKRVDVAGPGVDILSDFPPKGYARLSGTSMATPFVAGVVALLVSAQKIHGHTAVRNIKDLRNVIRRTAVNPDSHGFDTSYGWGLINPETIIPDDSLEIHLVKSDFTADGLAKLGRITKLIIDLT